MNVVLISSILIQVIATGWSVALTIRLRDWRMIFFTAMLAMMTARSALSCAVELSEHQFRPVPLQELVAEVPSVALSIVAVLALHCVGRMIGQSRRAARDLQRSQHILEDVPDLISRYRPDTTLTYVNEAYARFVDRPVAQILGHSFLDEIPDEDRDVVKTYIEDLCRRRGPGSIEHRVIRGDGEVRWFTWTDRALLDDDGNVVELQSIGRDITEHVAAVRALRDSEERIRTIADNIPGVVYSYIYRKGHPRRILFLGSGLAELTGPESARAVRENFDVIFEMLHDDDRERVRTAVTQALGVDALVDVDCRLRCDDGSYAWVRSLGRAIPLDDSSTCWHVVLIDINERKRIEERQQLLMNELDHRVKNNLAAVLALARQAAQASTSVEEFSEAFEGRIAAMSRTHEFLAEARWDGLEMADIVRITLGAYLDAVQPRVCAQGSRVVLPAAVAMPLSLALHELGANAVKHGALSNELGTIEVRWHRRGGMLHVSWREAGGPPVRPPQHPGTGTSLLNGFIGFELHGEIDMDFKQDGFCCDIRIPMDDGERSASHDLAAAAT